MHLSGWPGEMANKSVLPPCALASLCNFRLIATDYTCEKLVQISCSAVVMGDTNL